MIVHGNEVKPRILDEYSSRKILGTGGDLMMVEVTFKKDGIGTPHSHTDHEQVSYIAKGSFEVTYDKEVKVLKAGDSFYAGKNVIHGVKALEDGSVILDIFTPIREDFLK